MSSIDERVVQMKFENSLFERGVSTTLSTLQRLKQALRMDGAKNGIEDVSNSAKRFSMANMASAVQDMSNRFGIMGVAGVTAIATIANRAVSAGLQMAKSLTVDPVKSGLQEYETNLNSIQTILANTGLEGQKGLDKVNTALDELNKYSDKTIYNFAEMARNIGTFTAAGVDLDTSTAAIKGIANLAAVSGSNSQQASTAMYQLSQALAAGKVNLMDWNSVVNAGMGGKVFQNALMETARVHGVAIDDIVKKEGGFRNSVSKGWITSEIMTETLSKFTGDLSKAQLKSMGYNEEQIKGIMKMGKTAQEAATKVKTASQLISTLQEAAGSGWSKTWQLLFGDFEEARTLFTGLSDTLGGFITRSADARNKILGDWKELGGRTALIDGIAQAFNVVMEVLTPLKLAFRDIFPPMTGKRLYEMTVAFKNFMSSLKLGEGTMDNLRRTFRGVFAIFGIGFEILKKVGRLFLDLFGFAGQGAGGLLEFTANLGDKLTHLFDIVKNGKGFDDFFDGIRQKMAVAFQAIGGFISRLIGWFRDLDFISLDGITGGIDKMIHSFGGFDAIKQIVTNVIGFIRDHLGDIGDIFSYLFSDMDFSKIMTTINTGLFGALVMSIRGFLSNAGEGFGLSDLFGGISGAFEELTGTLGAMQNTLKAATLLQIAAAVGILTLAVIALSKLDSAGLTRATVALTIMFLQLGGAMALFAHATGIMGTIKLPLIAASLIVLSIAVVILASAVKRLSKLDWKSLVKGLGALGIILLELALFTKLADLDKGGLRAGAGLLLLALGLKLLVGVVSDFGDMKWENIGKGIIGIGALLAMLALFTNFTGGGGLLIASGIGLGLLALSMKLLLGVVKEFGSMKWSTIGKGLLVMAGALLIVGTALTLIPPTSPITAGGLLIFAVALKAIGSVIKSFGGMSWKEIGKGLITLAGALVIIAGAMMLMTGAVVGAGALLIVAGALAILAPILVTFSQLSFGEIMAGLGMLAGAFVIFGLAGLLLTPVIPTLLGLGVAIGLLGVGLLAGGLGLAAFGLGLGLIATAGKTGVEIFILLVESLIALIPKLAVELAKGIIEFAVTLGEGAPKIVGALVKILEALIDAIVRLTPKIVGALLTMLDMMLRAIADHVPSMVQSGLDILIGFLSGIKDNIALVVATVSEIIIAFLAQLAIELPKIIDAGVKLIIAFVNGMAKAIRDNSAAMRAAGANLASAIISGITGGLSDGLGPVINKAKAIASGALAAAKAVLGINSPSKEFYKIGMGVNEGFAMGIESYGRMSEKAAENVGMASINAMRKSIAGLSSLVNADIATQPVIRPVLDLSNVKSAAGSVKTMFGDPYLNLSTAQNASRRVYAELDPRSEGRVVNNTTNVNYTQHNQSPKSLSEIEIYRQTKNQLSTLKGVIK